MKKPARKPSALPRRAFRAQPILRYDGSSRLRIAALRGSAAMKSLEREPDEEIKRLNRLNRELAKANKSLLRRVSEQEELLHKRQVDFNFIVNSIPVQVAVTTPAGDVEALNK